MNLKHACLLDLSAPKLLEPSDAKNFDYFIFGGILGDHPAAGRTKALLADKVLWAEHRNLGPDQFSTDTAVLVTKKILDGTPLKNIPFTNDLEVHTKVGESVVLPYKYVLVAGKPVVAPGLVEMLAAQKGF
ncbi:hypothetical protein HY490_01900 [Candidatus Woesearchaeota archaeon]|nr:hypothetical protein [Candidatus Woesearchaeota archaeon]